ncbi:hypothetical protein BDW22DRAFT_1180685 [Trametopsis cervina]|nr:hypothetical protein BDW22DRAFT_1180685 [Trametopsis cervina]
MRRPARQYKKQHNIQTLYTRVLSSHALYRSVTRSSAGHVLRQHQFACMCPGTSYATVCLRTRTAAYNVSTRDTPGDAHISVWVEADCAACMLTLMLI